jgi:glycosyltransferase involved in cell wall biosynthesis
MRITFVNGLYPPHGVGGAENSLRLLAAELSSRGHICSIMTLTPESRARVTEVDGTLVHYLPLANVYWPFRGPRPRLLRPLFQAVDAFNPVMGARLARVLRHLRPDVVNCHNLQGFSVAAWVAAARLRFPIVQTVHDYYLACPRSTMWRPVQGNCNSLCRECRIFAAPRRALSSLPEAVTCVSHRVFDRLTKAGAFGKALAGVQPVRIIRGNSPNVVESIVTPTANQAPTFGFIGRLEHTKGLENLLDAFAGLPAKLLVAGRGEETYEAALKARAASNPDIDFLGHVDPARFFPRIDMLVIPSVWEDPFPRVFHEALAYGVPSLVNPLGGLPEVVIPGRNGFVASGTDAAALHTNLRRLIEGGWDRDRMRTACLADSAAYESERIATQYEAVLSAVCLRRRVPDEGAGDVWRPAGANGRWRHASQVVPHGL